MQSNYRKDIDGLRALAVLLVIFYHLGLPFDTAGFVGVDVFFVISGYLITSHIYQGLIDQQFSLKHFYLKRMRRILPALIVVLVFTSLAAYFLLLPKALLNYSHSLIAAICSVSNFYFWQYIHIGYFSTDASKLPLLHTWSLGVEEQFYLLWPLMLIFLVKRMRGTYLLFTFIALGVSSFALYILFKNHPQFVYYSPFTRAFELLAGATLAISSSSKINVNPQFNNVLSIIALSTIVYGGCYLTPSDYPSANVLLPVLGAVLFIFTGQRDAVANKIMSFKPLVFIGLISYSLYLWHWPIIAFWNYFGLPMTHMAQFGIVVSSMALATLTCKLIERPMRFKYKHGFGRTFSQLYALPVLMCFLFLMPVIRIPNFGFNQVTQHAKKVIYNDFYGFMSKTASCYLGTKRDPKDLGKQKDCSIGAVAASKTQVLLVGDSHAMSDAGMIHVLLKDAGLRGYVATKAMTSFLLPGKDSEKLYPKSVLARNPTITALINKYNYRYVVIGGAWQTYWQDLKLKQASLLKEGLQNDVAYLLKHNATPVFLLDFPPLFKVPVTCGATRVSIVNCANKLDVIAKYQNTTRQVLLSIKQQYPQVILIDPRKIICENGSCQSAIGGTPLYFNGRSISHLDFAGASLVGKLFLEKYANPFKANAEV